MSTNNQQLIKDLQERVVFLGRQYEFYHYAWLDLKTTGLTVPSGGHGGNGGLGFKIPGVTGPLVDHLECMMELAKNQKHTVETYLNELIRLETEDDKS